MPLTRVNLLAGFNRDDSPAWSVQDVCNFLPVVADQPGTTTQFKLRTPPGLKPYQRIGKGPIRGAHNAEGRLFVVSGQTLFEVSNKGVGIARGTVPGVGRVRMAHNQIKNGNQIAIANGQSGYIYNTVTQVFTRITDDGFPGAIDVVFINGYLFWIEPFGRYWLHSDLADGLNYNTLDRGEAESQPDRIVGVAVSQGDVLLFGERTTEFYRNTGQATGTFQSTGTTIDVGCASLHTIQNLDNSVMWLGNDGVIYRLDGLRAAPISTRAIEKAIAKYDWANAFAFTWEDEGHKVYYITFPDGETFGYDVVVGLWHRRESFGFKRWRLNGCVHWGRKWIGGDFQDGRLWLLDWDYVLEGSDELIATYTSAEVSDGGNRIGIPEMELLFDVGRESTLPVGFPVQVHKVLAKNPIGRLTDYAGFQLDDQSAYYASDDVHTAVVSALASGNEDSCTVYGYAFLGDSDQFDGQPLELGEVIPDELVQAIIPAPVGWHPYSMMDFAMVWDTQGLSGITLQKGWYLVDFRFGALQFYGVIYAAD